MSMKEQVKVFVVISNSNREVERQMEEKVNSWLYRAGEIKITRTLQTIEFPGTVCLALTIFYTK